MLGGPLGGQLLSDSFITVFQEMDAGEPGTQLAFHKYIRNIYISSRFRNKNLGPNVSTLVLISF